MREAVRSRARWFVVLGVVAGFLASAQFAFAAQSDFVRQTRFPQQCGSGIGVGIAFDGKYLWISCYASNPDLMRADPLTGEISATYNIDNGLGALAYDAERNALWAGWGGQNHGQVNLIQLDQSQRVVGKSLRFIAGAADINSIDDGLAFDATDNTLYISADTSQRIYQYTLDGTLLESFPWSGNGCYNSGLALGGALLFEASNGCNHIWVVNKNTKDPKFDFETFFDNVPQHRDEDLECDPLTFAASGKDVMWSKQAYSPNRADAFEISPDRCGLGGVPPAQVSLSPEARTNPVGTRHTLTANLKNPGGSRTGQIILFSVTGANPRTGSSTTDDEGNATFTYRGTKVGTDTITACYDTNRNRACDPEEQRATATKTWTAPPEGPPWEGWVTSYPSNCSGRVQAPFVDGFQQVAAYAEVFCPKDTQLSVRARLRSDYDFRDITVDQYGCLASNCVVTQPKGYSYYRLTCPRSDDPRTDQRYYTSLVFYPGTRSDLATSVQSSSRSLSPFCAY